MIGLTVLASLNVLSVAVFVYALRKANEQTKNVQTTANRIADNLIELGESTVEAIEDSTKQLDTVQDEASLTNLAVKDLLTKLETQGLAINQITDLVAHNEKLIYEVLTDQDEVQAKLDALVDTLADLYAEPRSPDLPPGTTVEQGSLSALNTDPNERRTLQKLPMPV
jgi:ABC-type transporter Mla subunit MlaD